MAKNDNLTDYLTDLADGIRAKKGTTEPINPQDFRKEIESISGGGNGGLGDEKFGMIYVHKKDILRIFELPEEIDVPQEELMGVMLNLLILPIVALKGAPANDKRINNYVSIITEEIYEGSFTWEALSYVALNFDAIIVNERREAPAWTAYGSSIDEARTAINSIFTEQITKEEFYSLK